MAHKTAQAIDGSHIWEAAAAHTSFHKPTAEHIFGKKGKGERQSKKKTKAPNSRVFFEEKKEEVFCPSSSHHLKLLFL